MLNSIRLSHLKCFGALRLDFASLTLLTGFNAAGKSSSYQPLLLLAQAFRSAPRSELLGLNGPLVRLGTAGEVLSGVGPDRPVGIEIDFADARSEWVLRPAERAGSGALAIERAILEVKGQEALQWSGHILPSKINSGAAERLFMAIQEVIYISAARIGAAEAFPAPDDAGISHADVGPRGEFAPWWYAQYADEEIDAARRHRNESAPTLRRQLDAFLSDLFPGAQANSEIIARTSLVRLGLRTDIESDWRRPINTGYGITYAFPVLVALLLAKPGQVVIIDSPEAHLHPRGQSTMGRLLAHFAAAGVQVIVETHSDHVLNGVRLAARDKVINPQGIAIYFFGLYQKLKDEQRVFRLRVDSESNIDAWPSGFFDQAEHDLAKLAGWDARP
jgi:predicted ATPase